MCLPFPSREKAFLAHIKVETLQTTVSERAQTKLVQHKINLSKYTKFQGSTLYLNPLIGYWSQILHLAGWLAFSAAARRCSTGNQTILWGSCCSQLKKWTACESKSEQININATIEKTVKRCMRNGRHKFSPRLYFYLSLLWRNSFEQKVQYWSHQTLPPLLAVWVAECSRAAKDLIFVDPPNDSDRQWGDINLQRSKFKATNYW